MKPGLVLNVSIPAGWNAAEKKSLQRTSLYKMMGKGWNQSVYLVLGKSLGLSAPASPRWHLCQTSVMLNTIIPACCSVLHRPAWDQQNIAPGQEGAWAGFTFVVTVALTPVWAVTGPAQTDRHLHGSWKHHLCLCCLPQCSDLPHGPGTRLLSATRPAREVLKRFNLALIWVPLRCQKIWTLVPSWA